MNEYEKGEVDQRPSVLKAVEQIVGETEKDTIYCKKVSNSGQNQSPPEKRVVNAAPEVPTLDSRGTNYVEHCRHIAAIVQAYAGQRPNDPLLAGCMLSRALSTYIAATGASVTAAKAEAKEPAKYPVAPALTPAASKVLEAADMEARVRSQFYTATEHLLLGLLQHPNCAGARVLTNLHVTSEKVLAMLGTMHRDGYDT